MYCLTVGYPLGAEIIDNRQVFQVSLNSRTIRLLPVEYRIWSRFLLGAYDNDVFKTLSEQDRNGFVPTMNKLVQVGLLAVLQDDNYSEMPMLKFLRQGIGIGFEFETNTYNVMFREKVQLTSLEYAVWKEADGLLSYREIERRIVLKYQCPVLEVQNTLVRLCRRGLVISVNKEER